MRLINHPCDASTWLTADLPQASTIAIGCHEHLLSLMRLRIRAAENFINHLIQVR